MQDKKYYLNIYNCKIFNELKHFILQSISDPADLSLGVVVYFFLSSILFVFSWLGDELTAEVSALGHFNFSFIFSAYNAVQKITFSCNNCQVARTIQMFCIHISTDRFLFLPDYHIQQLQQYAVDSIW
jgi:hypothetical protein